MSKTKATCILNGAIAPDLQSSLVEKMKSAVYSLATDGSSDQNLEKMNPLTMQYFDESQHKVVTQFLDICLSRSCTAEGIFSSLNAALEKHNIPWYNCIALGVDNTSVNVGKHKSIIVEAKNKNSEIKLMGRPCHIAHNTAQYATCKFEEIINGFKRKRKSDGEKQKKKPKDGFNSEEFLVDLYFHFEYSSKKKNLLCEYFEFCNQAYAKIIKFHSVCWLRLSTCLKRLSLKFEPLKSYFLSQEPEKRPGRLNRLISAFNRPMTELYVLFLQETLPALTNLNLLLQRADPVIHVMYDAFKNTVSVLLERVFKADLLKKYNKGIR